MYAGSMKLFGTGEWAVRLPCVLAFAFSTIFTALVAFELSRNRSIAMIAGGLQLISPLALVGSHVVTTDVFLAAAEPAYVWAFLKTLNADKNGRLRWAIIAWALAALAFMTKGPPALLSALACLVFLIIKRKEYPQWRAFVRPIPLLLFFLLSGWWYVAVLIRIPDALEVWKTEAVEKVLVHSERNMPPYEYLGILAVGALPAVIALGIWLFNGAARKLVSRVKAKLQNDHVLLCTLWIFIPLVIFMLAKTRLPLYVLPLITPFNVLAAYFLARRWGSDTSFKMRNVPRAWQALAVAILVLHTATKIALGHFDDKSKDMRPVAAAIRSDAERIGKKPQLMLNMEVMGNGILYYLDGPPTDRVERTKPAKKAADENSGSDEVGNGKKKHHGSSYRMRNQAFTKKVEPGHALYIVMQADREKRYLKRFSSMVDRVYQNPHWAVWRRTTELDNDVPTEKEFL